jgi:RNA polymerase sigma-70 factor, ECF subfamily
MEDFSDQKTDEEIIKLVQQGQVELFGLIVKKYQNKLLRYGNKFLNRSEDIEEIVQEIFIKTYINIQSFDLSKKFSSWIYRIAHNEFINALKKKRPLYFFNLDVFLPHLISKENPEEDIAKKEIQELISGYLTELEPKYKEVLILYYFEDLSYKDISDILHIPISTVGVRIKRAKKIMKNLYERNN